MQIVIEIEDEDYKSLQVGHIPFSILEVIKNGRPLPKEYGRLIEAEKLKDSIMTITRNTLVNSVESALGMALYKISNAPTIIEGTEVNADDTSMD